jgi:hypothetical protein
MNKYPICIVSKDRPDICKTHNLLEYSNIKYFYMVEPQDYNTYVKRFGKDKVVDIKENDKGIYYVRNFCIEWSKKNGYSKHWQVDDDLNSLHYREMDITKGLRNTEKIIDPINMLLYIEEIADRCVNYGAGCLTHDGFAFAKKKDIDINKMIYCFQLINNSIKSRYQPNTSEDVDFSVRILKEGYVTMVFNKYSFRTPSSGSIKGGCNSSVDYKKRGNIDGRKLRNLKLCETYPQWFIEYTKKGQSEIKASKIWKSFKQIPLMKK